MGCAACEGIARIRRGEHPLFVAELGESYVLLHEHQHWEGWCVLVLKEHVEHLADLPVERQARLFENVARVAGAVRREVGAARMNYACLGNVMAHVHWHVIPRGGASDIEPAATVWTRPRGELEAGVDAARAQMLVGRLRRAIEGT